MIRDTSLASYHDIRSRLSAKQQVVMAAVKLSFGQRAFTRKQLARALNWEINRVTGRVLELVEKGYLHESGCTKEHGRSAHLLRIGPVQLSLFAA